MTVAEPWRPARAALDRMTQGPVLTLVETGAVMLVRSAATISVPACHNAAADREQSRVPIHSFEPTGHADGL
jgi:hypothetical protein